MERRKQVRKQDRTSKEKRQQEALPLQVAKPRLLPIVDPNSGKTIDTLGMNFEPRKPSSPLKIVDPTSGEAVDAPGRG